MQIVGGGARHGALPDVTANQHHAQLHAAAHAAAGGDPLPIYPVVAALAADVTITLADTYYAIASVALGIGTWDLEAVAQIQGDAAGVTWGGKLSDGTTIFGIGNVVDMRTGGGFSQLYLMGRAILVAPATMTLSVFSRAALVSAQKVLAAGGSIPVGSNPNVATWIRARQAA